MSDTLRKHPDADIEDGVFTRTDMTGTLARNSFFGVPSSGPENVYVGAAGELVVYLGARTEAQLYLGAKSLWP